MQPLLVRVILSNQGPIVIIEHRAFTTPFTIKDSELPFIGSIARGNRQLEANIIGTSLQGTECLSGLLVHERTTTLYEVVAG